MKGFKKICEDMTMPTCKICALTKACDNEEAFQELKEFTCALNEYFIYLPSIQLKKRRF